MSAPSPRSRLRELAATHEPDRAAILRRIRRGQAGLDPSAAMRSPRRRAAVRAAGMVATVSAVLGLGVAVTWAAAGSEPLRKPSTGTRAVAPSPAAAPPANVVPQSVPSRGGASRPAYTSNPVPSSPASPEDRRQQGFLASHGAVDPHSIDNWTQSNVTLRIGETATALEVQVRIVLTPHVAGTGAWSTVVADNLVTAVEQHHDALVYRFTLKPGVQLAPGTYVFAVQFNHATGGRDAGRDGYRAAATGATGRVEVEGGF